jgi:hypothetical protein
MKWQAQVVLILLSTLALVGRAQSSTEDRSSPQQTQMRGYWVDPSTSLMWAGKDNGRDASWQKATKYCRNMRLAGYSDWRLATIDELQPLYDRSAEAPGRAGDSKGGKPRDFPSHVKGNLFLTGSQWSSSRDRLDDRGHPAGGAWFFNFDDGERDSDYTSYSTGKRALCVRRSGE